MKISNSKKQLAKIIHENDGWIVGGFAAQQDDGEIWFSATKPIWKNRCGTFDMGYEGHFTIGHLIANRHQTILSRSEYLHLYPAPDADGWIEYNGDGSPYSDEVVVEAKWSDGDFTCSDNFGPGCAWIVNDGEPNITHHRLHKPEQAKAEFCESVARSIPDHDEHVWTNSPTIEQLAADYRNAKDLADRKQQEADAAKDDADAKLKALELAGEALGLIVSPIAAKHEPGLLITDWRDLRVGDVIRCIGDWQDEETHGVLFSVDEIESPEYGYELAIRVVLEGGTSAWGKDFEFIRRP